MTVLEWDIYEVTTNSTVIKGVMLRGRLRKLALDNQINLLTENATDVENCVRFAVLFDTSTQLFTDYISQIVPDATVTKVLEKTPNPVLSKLKVNMEERYTL